MMIMMKVYNYSHKLLKLIHAISRQTRLQAWCVVRSWKALFSHISDYDSSYQREGRPKVIYVE